VSHLSRRRFIAAAAALGASFAFGQAAAAPSRSRWKEQRERFKEGVASGDPAPDSVLLWTRYTPGENSKSAPLTLEVAEDQAFTQVIATTQTDVAPTADWTCRVLVGGLKPAREYWYRFSDALGNGSRIGRTLTAPTSADERPARFAFISCQNANDGAQNAYRRMIFEDQNATPDNRLGFVLHLGDFIYELVWYPEDRPKGMYDRRIRDIVRYAHGEKHDDFHIPTTAEDYRAIYRAYLHDPDLQDARARWPFVSMWDNHEFSWKGWQSLQTFEGKTLPRQTRKVAAMQAWFEYLPARVKKPSATLERFDAPHVTDAAITRFDDNGLGLEVNNAKALASLTGYRTLRYGKHIDLIVTDQRSYRSEEPTDRIEAKAFSNADFPEMFPLEALEILDAGKVYNGNNPPANIRYGDQTIDNFRKDEPAQTILGATQRAWFLQQLKSSTATWKIWGNTTGTLDWRLDPQNLPQGLTKPWPGAGYAGFGGGDHGSAFVERAEIYDFIAREGITGFATVAGDRHSFWAGLAAKSLPPDKFEPVGIAFVTGSISAPGLIEAYEHKFPKDHPLRALYLHDVAGAKPEPTINLTMLHGVRASLEYARSGDIVKARAARNPDNAPHLSFLDMGGHGYAVVRASQDLFETEFVCIPRPVERNESADGGALLYRVVHRARRWNKGERPNLEQLILEGDPRFSI
jgi:alkaline phosphatase D